MLIIMSKMIACRAGEIFSCERSHRKTFSRHFEFLRQWKKEISTEGVNDRQEEG